MVATRRRHLLVSALLASAAAALAPVRADGLAAVRGALSEWVQTHQLLSQTRADWSRDKELLDQSTALYERELKTLGEQMTRVGTNTVFLAEQREAALARQQVYVSGLELAARRLGELESRVRGLQPVLPPVLRATVGPLLNKLPADPASTNVSPVARMQTLITILNEVDKFQSSVTITEETRPAPDGREVAVNVLYAGLGQAWFADQKGTFGGVGVPGPAGWEWTTRNEAAPGVARAIRMYRNEVPAEFVALPVQVR